MINTAALIVVSILVGMTLAATSLLAIWAAFSLRPWHHRAIVLLAVLALFLPPGMYEPILFFTVQWAMIIGPLACIRRLWIARFPYESHGAIRTTRSRFHLRDLCWLVTLSAVAIALCASAARHSGPFSWQPMLGQAAIIASIAVSAAVALLLRGQEKGSQLIDCQ